MFDKEDINQLPRQALPELHLYLDGKRVDKSAYDLNTIVPTSDANIFTNPENTGLPARAGLNVEIPANAQNQGSDGPIDALSRRLTSNNK